MSTKRTLRGTGVLAILILAAGAAIPAEAHVDCTASFEPEAVPVQDGRVDVRYTLSEPIGPITGVSAQAESGLEVLGHDDMNRRLELDTSGGSVGQWSITFTGEGEVTCTGSLAVQAPGG